MSTMYVSLGSNVSTSRKSLGPFELVVFVYSTTTSSESVYGVETFMNTSIGCTDPPRRYCIIFVSDDYAGKVWTSHERRSAQARAIEENNDYVLPARFDDTEVPDLRSTVGHIDLRDVDPTELARTVRQKWCY